MTPITYTPRKLVKPLRMPTVPTAWDGNELIIEDLIERFQISPKRCIEFGVQHGWSTAALASYFTHVIGVDTFAGDKMAGVGDSDHTFNGTRGGVKSFPNITLGRTSYQDLVRKDDSEYDLVHVDIVHTFEDSY